MARTRTYRSNRYPGTCRRCGGRVEAEAGVLVKDAADRWQVEHWKKCPMPQLPLEPEFRIPAKR